MRVAFGPFMRSGKDTACLFLRERYGGKILSFSWLLYKACDQLQKTLGIPVEKDRPLLLQIGAYAKEKDPLVFVKQVREQIELHNKDNIFVSDVRRKEEADMLKQQGFLLVKILRDTEREYSEMEEKAAALDVWDIVLENNGTIQEFEAILEQILGQ
uniref:Deoxynucleotide monophosphatekinase n=1 Tax=Marseillevirus sp. TaxID=2809551 RepID=A0AA96IXN7_9VIRU|nr:deoxynucleotide monophosphatekinase [Marseillevirus sp.]